MKRGYPLTKDGRKNGQIVMSFDAPGGAQQANFDAVILALPFTCLRNVKGLDRMHLSPEKLKCIRELGMGQNAKIMVGTTSRVWRTSASDLPVPSNGSVCSDLAFQDFWETSRAQPGDAGILTNFLGGKAALTDAEVGAQRLPRRPRQDVAEDGQKYRQEGSHIILLESLSIHARQLCKHQRRTIHRDVGCRLGTSS